MPKLCFLDYETTGLDPAKGSVLEIGMLIADGPTFQELGSWSTPIKPSYGDWMDQMDNYVLKMHSESGLIEELRGERSLRKFEAGGLPTLQQAEATAVQLMDQTFGTVKPELCGANPEFDRGWMKAHMPKLAERFHYRNFDTNAFWLLKSYAEGTPVGKPQGKQAHRALPDCRRELQAVIDHFQWIGGVLGGEGK